MAHRPDVTANQMQPTMYSGRQPATELIDMARRHGTAPVNIDRRSGPEEAA
ncbi:MAG: hypothetical protein Q4G14_04860 [Paracoccus sp. (in: a-proteobacteria)]|nr:hypothetical protein [Paracoccus sp. (in: a-proteobacteria)]